MSDFPNDAAVSRAVAAAKGALSAEDAVKLERLARNKDSLKGLTSKLSERDWANVMRIINDPDLMKRVLSSSQGKHMLHDFLKRMN
ncbi:MAG: hypothetical protein J6B86_05020 [Clostridia bacterium]|nr:hypothetical protein [Clostridia bacterium]